jgi:hypothetical protein
MFKKLRLGGEKKREDLTHFRTTINNHWSLILGFNFVVNCED